MRRVLGGACSLFAVTIIACGGGAEGSGDAEMPWVTQVDSTGDTIRVRITGEIPASLVRSIVAEVQVGAEDGAEEETFGEVAAVVPMPDRGFLAYDEQASALRRFDATGAFVKNIGRKGGGPGEFEHVNGVARLPDGRIVLWDAAGARINVYSDTGAFQETWRVPFTGFFSRHLIWTDRDNRTYTWAVLEPDSIDFSRSRSGVIVFDPKGVVLDSLKFPRWGEPPPSLIARSPDGRGASSYSFPFWPTSRPLVSPLGGFVSGPGGAYTLYLTDRVGAKPVRIDRESTPVPVSAAERSENRAMVEHGLRQTDPNWSWSVADIPSNKPAYETFYVAADGRVWVKISTPAEAIPAAELPVARAGDEARPRFTTRTPTVFDVFSAEGRLLGRVAFPRQVSLQDAIGNDVYAIRRDSLDVQYVVRYRIEPALPR